MKRQLVEITTRNQVTGTQCFGETYEVKSKRLLVCEHHFPGTANHRLIASGRSIGPDGDKAAWAALRLMQMCDG